MNPWSVQLWSCPFIQWIKSVSLLLLGSGFILRGSVFGGESRRFESLSLSFFVPFPTISVALCMCIIKRPKVSLSRDVKIIEDDLLLQNIKDII